MQNPEKDAALWISGAHSGSREPAVLHADTRDNRSPGTEFLDAEPRPRRGDGGPIRRDRGDTRMAPLRHRRSKPRDPFDFAIKVPEGWCGHSPDPDPAVQQKTTE